jgi:hypothetical protein
MWRDETRDPSRKANLSRSSPAMVGRQKRRRSRSALLHLDEQPREVASSLGGPIQFVSRHPRAPCGKRAGMGVVYGALVGAFVTGLLAWLKGYLDYVTERKRALRAAAFSCLDRLEKIQHVYALIPPDIQTVWEQRLAEDDDRKKTLRNELNLLGPNLDHYLSSIAAARRNDRHRHFRVYRQMRPILIERRVQRAPAVIEDLRRELGTDAL